MHKSEMKALWIWTVCKIVKDFNDLKMYQARFNNNVSNYKV